MAHLDPGEPPPVFAAEHEGVLAEVNHDIGHGAARVAAVVVILASRMGHITDPKVLRLAWSALPPHAADGWSETGTQPLFAAAEEAGHWLTEHHAPEGFCFDFTDSGDFELRRARTSADITTRPQTEH